jgi:Flp pilus assembly protein TadG
VTTRDRGAADAIGLVIMVVPMFAFAVLVFYVGRNVDARAQLRSATESAAQAAALERNAVDGETAARMAFGAMVGPDRCPAPDFDITYRDGKGAVEVQLVEVVVTCDVPDDGFEGLGLDEGANQGVAFTAVATVDYFRAARG